MCVCTFTVFICIFIALCHAHGTSSLSEENSIETRQRVLQNTTSKKLTTAAIPTLAKENTRRPCTPIHAEAHGISLICCSKHFPLLDHCEYSSMCNSDECRCTLEISNIDCFIGSAEKPFIWSDHQPNTAPLSCVHSNLPYKNNITYEVTVKKWNNLTATFLSGLCHLNMVSLSFYDLGIQAPLMDLSICFPNLESLSIVLEKEEPIDIYPMFRSLRKLTHLRIINVDFEFWQTISPWAVTVTSLHIENSTMYQLPRWLIKNDNLIRIFIKGTELTSLDAVSQLRRLKSAKLSHNQITDVHKIIFASKDLYDIDLGSNQISSLSSHTFSRCSELRSLDLSHNPIRVLPHRAFLNAGRLKWLKLSDTRIAHLVPEHFVGLSSLKSLSLSGTPITSISPFAFLPLKHLKSIDLQGTNLTKLPPAITQLCHLTHVNMADNLLMTRGSLPPEVTVHLSSLSFFRLDGNPLKEFPSALLLLSTDNTRLIREIVHTMTMLPVWTSDPCTPFYWNIHLKNSSQSLRHLVSVWNEDRMKREGLHYCREQYEWMIDNQEIYRELEKNSGCTVSRSLRRATQHTTVCEEPGSITNNTSTNLQNHTRKHWKKTIQKEESKASQMKSEDCAPHSGTLFNLLALSIGCNIFFICVLTIAVCACYIGGRRRKYQAY